MKAVRHSQAMQNMRRIREEKRLTQADLAEMTGLGQGYLSKIEVGTANPSLDKILLIAKALGVEPHQLFPLPDLQARIMAAISAIADPARQEAAAVVLEAMAGNPRDQEQH